MKAKHTKTPWRRDEYGGIYPVKTGVIEGGYCIVRGVKTLSKAKADELFVVRACNAYDDLLEACRKAITCQASMNSDVVALIQAAIAKAT